MSKPILFLEQLPDDFGKKGGAFKQDTEYLKDAKDFVHRHASEAGLALAIVSFAMVVF